MWLSKHCTLRGPSRALPLFVCWRDCLQPPCPSSRPLPLLHTNSPLKGFIGLNAPSDSCGHLPPWHAQVSSAKAFHLVSGLRPVSHFVCSPPMALTGERRGGRAGSQAGSQHEGRERRQRKEDDEDKKEEEIDAWRVVELHKLALRNRHYSSSHNDWLLSHSFLPQFPPRQCDS